MFSVGNQKSALTDGPHGFHVGIAQGLSSVRASQLRGEAVKGSELTRIKFARLRASEFGGLARASSTRLGPAGPCCLGKA